MANPLIGMAATRSFTIMRMASIILAVVSLLFGMFSWSGINTVEGQHAYDEMAAIVPYSSGLLAVILAAAAIFLFWLSSRNARS